MSGGAVDAALAVLQLAVMTGLWVVIVMQRRTGRHITEAVERLRERDTDLDARESVLAAAEVAQVDVGDGICRCRYDVHVYSAGPRAERTYRCKSHRLGRCDQPETPAVIGGDVA
jgi:hypothetical protein